jgi:hypothetical protein
LNNSGLNPFVAWLLLLLLLLLLHCAAPCCMGV